ncbi:MAG: YggS family pyridoxal phosphate-dependent enzyme [Prolixibacteraceae bacterium]|nr:YggS family pyridoxal phosphate-dependent enzyme [Prolixibacteraceae bacterium]
MTTTENLKYIQNQLPAKVKLVAVSKTKSNDQILEAFRAGQRLFGENKVQEMTAKWHELPKEIEWHYIGHLQTNKVKYIAPFVALIHSVDSFKLLSAINKEADKCGRIIPVLLEFHIAEEESKFGLTMDMADQILSMPEIKSLYNITISGVMGMATFTNELSVIRSEFEHLYQIYQALKNKYFQSSDQFCEISMGMSDDYPIALEAGSTIVRIGSKIFGSR